MATTGDERPWAALALAGAVLVHAPVLAGGLLDADRLLLHRNADVWSFAGLGAMLAGGEPLMRASWLVVRNHAPLGVLSTWLGWQWFRASPAVQHAVGLGILLAVAWALQSLLAPRRALAAAASLVLVLHPAVADLTGPILGRDFLLAILAVLLAARRAREAPGPAAITWSAGASLVAGMCAPGWGPLGLAAALGISGLRARRLAVGASLAASLAALAPVRADLAAISLLDAIGPGAGTAFFAWLPSARPFVVATAGDPAIAGLVPVIVLATVTLFAASRVPGERDAALLRAGAGAMIASLPASAMATRAGTVTGAAAVALQLGVVLALAGIAGARGAALVSRCRPWMVSLFAIPAVVTAARARAWADEEQVLAAVVARAPDDPEALLARARLGLRRGRLDEAVPFCARYAAAAPETWRADGCLAAAAAHHDPDTAVLLLQRWAAGLDDRHALRAAALEIAEAQPAPGLAVAFQRATGFVLPARRPGDQP